MYNQGKGETYEFKICKFCSGGWCWISYQRRVVEDRQPHCQRKVVQVQIMEFYIPVFWIGFGAGFVTCFIILLALAISVSKNKEK